MQNENKSHLIPPENPDATNDQWWYELSGAHKGPLSKEKIQRLIANGILNENNLVWTVGWAEWLPIKETEFSPDYKVTVPPPLPKIGTVLPNSTSGIYTPPTIANATEDGKWYNNNVKLGLSLLIWPAFIYGLFRTNLIEDKTKKRIAGVIIALIIIGLLNSHDKGGTGSSSTGPSGKGFVLVSRSGFGEYSFGNTYQESADFLNLGWTYTDENGSPIRTIRRTGHFKVEGNTIICAFNDGQPPYKIDYRQDSDGGSIVDENGQTWTWDDPSKRNN